MSGSGIDGAVRARLRRAVRGESRRPVQPEVAALVEALRDRFGEQFVAALYYGSCRHQARIEGVVDLHVLVEDPVAALGPVAGRLCRWLPPNVHYLEIDHGGTRIRCKYAVLGRARFRRLSTRRGFHSYFWARYAQPLTVLARDRDPELQRSLEESLVDALATLFSRALPRTGTAGGDPLAFWQRVLALTYRCELRPETGDRGRALIDAAPDYFRTTGRAALDAAPAIEAAATPVLTGPSWALRIGWGKPVSLLRLLKALHTFDGGLDYAVWKLERHTGRHIEIPDAVRRRPWLHLWPHLWRLWRQGVLR